MATAQDCNNPISVKLEVNDTTRDSWVNKVPQPSHNHGEFASHSALKFKTGISQ